MRYFSYLSDGDRRSLFSRQSEPFYKTSERDILRKAVGGLLYIPGLNQTIAQIIIKGKVQGLTSMAICLEDAVGDQERQASIENTARQLERLERALSKGILPRDALPLLFVRVKDPDMLEEMANLFVQYGTVLTGVILPKVSREGLERALPIVAHIHARSKDPFYLMPILESAALMHCGDRIGLLQDYKSLLDAYFPHILNVRVGTTDLCGLYGVRRHVDTPIYSVGLAGACIADVVRVFALEDRYTVSGPVWEYFTATAKARATRDWSEIEGLMREVRLDLQNGVWGKTCIHPTQLLPVQASYVVPYEDYCDAVTILGGDRNRLGILPSDRRNKMNELKPHALWASKLLSQADLYGVYQENTDARGLLRAVYNGACNL